MSAPPLQVAALMRGFGPDWFVAGGWAIDLYLGAETRPHADIEIAIFRRDQLALQEHLDGWLLQKVVDGKLSVWRRDEWLALPVHEIHCSHETAEPRRLEVLLNERGGDEWVYRRDERARRPLAACLMLSDSGVRFLCPEVVLLYKSKQPRDKDEHDFAAIVPRLDAARRRWLRDAIAVSRPGHRWLQSL
jgi:hypothetical protein